ncbi:MAG: hypothetical protein ACRD96_04510 [Bryobacteraceae bacterium]
MHRSTRIRLFALAALFALALTAMAASEYVSSLKSGKAELKSAGALAFGPDGILLVGDSLGGAVFAIDTGDSKSAQAKPIEIAGLGEKVAAALGVAADQILINDVIVNPLSKRAYLSVSRGRGPDALPVILRTDSSGKLEEVPMTSVKHARVELPNAPSPDAKGRGGALLRAESITDLAYVDGRVFVAGLSSEEFASTLRAIPFPFRSADKGTAIEIFHGAHGRFETASPVRTFVPYEINKEAHLLAAYTCTPLVKFPVAQLKAGAKIMGTTIAELGNRNRPLDMIVYKQGGIDHILMNNSSRGVMKMSTEKIASFGGITKQTDITGLPYETIAHLKGVEQLDKLDDKYGLILVRGEGGALDLKTISLP